MAKQQYSAKDFRDDLLRVLVSKAGGKANLPVSHKIIYDDVAVLKGVTRDQYGFQGGTKIMWVDRWIQWAFKALVDEGLGKRAGKGQWALTPQGVKEAQGLGGDGAPVASDTGDDTDSTPTVNTGGTVSLMVGPGQTENDYHNDPYIRALAAKDTSCFGAYSDKSPTCTRCPMAGACMNEMAAELSSLARELAQTDKESEARRKMGLKPPKDDDIDNSIPASAVGGDKAKANADAILIEVQQQAICKHCGKVIPKGEEGYWIRSSGENTGGLYHKDCLEVGD